MKQRHRLHAALGATAALASGAGLALACVPTPPRESQPATHYPVSSSYATTSAELAQLRAELAGSAEDATLLQSVVVRLQRQVDLAQSRLERLTPLRHDDVTPTAVPTRPRHATRTAAPTNTAAPTKARHSPTAPPPTPTPTPSDDDGSDDD